MLFFLFTAHITTCFPTDDDNIESDSDVDQHNEDIAEAGRSRSEYVSSLNKSDGILWNRPALSKSSGNQDTSKDGTMARSSELMYSAESYSTKDGVPPMMLQTQSPSPLQTLDFSSAHSQQFLKLGAPLLFHPGQLSVKPEVTGRLLSSLPAVENGGLASTSPFMFHFSQHMLASQVRVLYHNHTYFSCTL